VRFSEPQSFVPTVVALVTADDVLMLLQAMDFVGKCISLRSLDVGLACPQQPAGAMTLLLLLLLLVTQASGAA
jgi:hypothetical protein